MAEELIETQVEAKKSKKLKKLKRKVQEDLERGVDEPNQNESQPADSGVANSSSKNSKKRFKRSVEAAAQNPAADKEEIGLDGMPNLAMSKRKKKQIKHVQVIEKNRDKEVERVASYLKLWSENREEWKYEKLRQIFIQKNIYDENLIADDLVDLAIEYLSSTKGAARKNILKMAAETMSEIEQRPKEESNSEISPSARYKRARQILQTMEE